MWPLARTVWGLSAKTRYSCTGVVVWCFVGDWFQGDHTEALSHYERALEIDRSLFGPHHPTVAKTLSNMGAVYQKMVCGVVPPLPH